MRNNSWTDTDGNPWPVVVNTSLIRACREKLNLELIDVPDIFQRLASDLPLLTDVLYLASKKLADERKISAEDFADLLRGDVWEGAGNAIRDAIIDFFPTSRREVLLGLREKMDLVTTEGIAIGNRQIHNRKLESAIKTALAKAEADIEARWSELGGVSTNSPDMSE